MLCFGMECNQSENARIRKTRSVKIAIASDGKATPVRFAKNQSHARIIPEDVFCYFPLVTEN
jgi:hypothetical protein